MKKRKEGERGKKGGREQEGGETGPRHVHAEPGPRDTFPEAHRGSLPNCASGRHQNHLGKTELLSFKKIYKVRDGYKEGRKARLAYLVPLS